MLKNWRMWVLVVLLVGPIVAYVCIGSYWLAMLPAPLGIKGGWFYLATTIWFGSGVAFAVLANRWTKSKRALLPPLDWEAPHTFVPRDLEAWKIVEREAGLGEAVSMDELTGLDIYTDTGRRLATELARHYHPEGKDPIEHVPVVEVLTALQLAAEDLAWLCREIPGGDLITPAHWKKAVQAAGYLQKANDIYSILLPIFSPVTGLMRLSSQQLMVRPAWRNMQQNILRWFFQAYVNRLGVHLIELYSGRLAIGADQYRRLTRKGGKEAPEIQRQPLAIAVVGARDAGAGRLVEALEQARTSGNLSALHAKLGDVGFDTDLAEVFRRAAFVEIPPYTSSSNGTETARDRSSRKEAVEEAVEADLLLLVIDMERETLAADAQFVEAWASWFSQHPGRERPPALVVLVGADRPSLGDGWFPPYDWNLGRGRRERAVRARMEAVEGAFAKPPVIAEIEAVGLEGKPSFGVAERLVPALALVLHRAERVGTIRQLHNASARSKARRFLTQVGRQGRRLWTNVKATRRPNQKAG